MNFLLFGEGQSAVSPSYFVLIEYIFGLSFFIAAWVFVIVGYQVMSHRAVSPIEGESNSVEFLWTFVPTLAVFFLSVLNVGCFNPEFAATGFEGVKVVGRQWYWSYGLSGWGEELFDSVMGDFVDTVDKPLRLEGGKAYCLFVTSADVIHSFSVPFLSAKVDAIPGRINQYPLISDVWGRHVGYCSELCGAGHAYMPIVVEVVPPPASVRAFRLSG